MRDAASRAQSSVGDQPSSLQEPPTAVLVMAHGTPYSPEELESFTTEVRRGRVAPPELLAELARRYETIGGISPLNRITQAQVRSLGNALEMRQPGRFVVGYGARFSNPRISSALAQLVASGCEKVVGVVLAPHSSVLSVGHYRELAEQALEELGSDAQLLMVESWHTEPGLISLLADRVKASLWRLANRSSVTGVEATTDVAVLFTAHSVPNAVVDQGDTYPEQVHETARLVAESCGLDPSQWSVAWQSAGKEGEWLGPDLLCEIRRLGESAASSVLVCPVGFVSDHLEVLYDIDVEARAAARGAGLGFERTDSLNDDPRLAETLADVVETAVS